MGLLEWRPLLILQACVLCSSVFVVCAASIVLDVSVFRCLSAHRLPDSLAGVWRMLPRCEAHRYCRHNHYTQFPNQLCGLITSLPGQANRRWYITQNSSLTFKWHFLEFDIYRVDSSCSFSRLEFSAEGITSRICGRRLPWYQYVKGSVVLHQLEDIHLKNPSSFTCFFEIYKPPKISPSSFFTQTYEHNKQPVIIKMINEDQSITFSYQAYQHSIISREINGDLIFYFVGHLPFMRLMLDLTVRSSDTARKLILHDGPSTLCPKLEPSFQSLSFDSSWIWRELSSSFQALLVVTKSWLDSDSLIAKWSIHREDIYGYRFTHLYPCQAAYREDDDDPDYVTRCAFGDSEANGRHHLTLLTDLSQLILLSFWYRGPDTHAGSLNEMCQYGGIWIYVSLYRDFRDPKLVFRHCSPSARPIYSEFKYCASGYLAVASVQYRGISTTQIEYDFRLFQDTEGFVASYCRDKFLVRPKVYSRQNEYVEDYVFDNIISFTSLSDLNNTLSIVFNKSNEMQRMERREALEQFMYIGEGADCSCSIDLFTSSLEYAKKPYCAAAETVTGRESFTWVASNEWFRRKIVKDVSKMRLQCGECRAGGFIYVLFSATEDPLWKRSDRNEFVTEVGHLHPVPHQCVMIRDTYLLYPDRTTFRKENVIHNTQELLLNITAYSMPDGELGKVYYSFDLHDCAEEESSHWPVVPYQKLRHITQSSRISIKSTYYCNDSFIIFGEVFTFYLGKLEIAVCHMESFAYLRAQFPYVEVVAASTQKTRAMSWVRADGVCQEEYNSTLPVAWTEWDLDRLLGNMHNYGWDNERGVVLLPLRCAFTTSLHLAPVSVRVVGDENTLAMSEEPCAACSSHTYCAKWTTAAAVVEELCPFLVLKGSSHIRGYTLMPCAKALPMPAFPCMVALAPLTTQAPRAALSFREPNCWPYEHRMESLCFTFPHLVPTQELGHTHCKCKDAGLSMFNRSTETEGLFLRYVSERALGFFKRIANVTIWSVLKFERQTVEVYSGKVTEGHGFPNEYYFPDATYSPELCATPSRPLPMTCPAGFMTCRDQTCIVDSSRCDGVNDCVDGDDELGCSRTCTRPHPLKACAQCSVGADCRCHALYFQCSSGGCVPASALCDGLETCTDGSDEALCQPGHELRPLWDTDIAPCLQCLIRGQDLWAFKRLCVYSHQSVSEEVIHLLDCEEWQCSSMYKCRAGFCMPLHYVCDRVCNCPHCDDEEDCEAPLSCPGMVKCKGGYPCVHSYHVQDGHAHCLRTRDDEVKYPSCPASACSCHGASITCAHSYATVPSSALTSFRALTAAGHPMASLHHLLTSWEQCRGNCQPLMYLDISNISNWEARFLTQLAQHIADLHVLDASHNQITILEATVMRKYISIIHLYLQNCGIHTIQSGTFVTTSLHVLDLSHNKLGSVVESSFGRMQYLRHIGLRDNQIESISLAVFRESALLRSVDLRGNKIHAREFDPSQWTAGHVLAAVFSDEHLLCCIIPTTESCTPAEDQFNSCSTLLMKPRVRYTLITLGITILALHIVSAWYLMSMGKHERKAKEKRFLISAVHIITDSLQGIHLVGLFIADIIYGGDFGKFRAVWNESILCGVLETCMSLFLTLPPVLVIHMGVSLLYSNNNFSSHISYTQYRMSVVIAALACFLWASTRRILMASTRLVEANTFCFPFLMSPSRSHGPMIFESLMVVCYTLVVLASLVCLSLVIGTLWRQEKLMTGKNSKKSKSRVYVKLGVYVCMIVCSKLVLLGLWIGAIHGSPAGPEIFALAVSCTCCIWSLCHPFLHTLKAN